ncbi:hypothetical protein PAXINDRAFT_16978 [Paxillus involutus ATCC 200175]|uniref:Uncharacterized protein n=1 Tax=Paxillus involutus ATCC 200175 TaxID=664439 RepID=A0A0C9T2T6_PAXIN|nr:hypothetical protein PAXINDRAFT_16978 [Paxillus involutus ATCC 200175]
MSGCVGIGLNRLGRTKCFPNSPNPNPSIPNPIPVLIKVSSMFPNPHPDL